MPDPKKPNIFQKYVTDPLRSNPNYNINPDRLLNVKDNRKINATSGKKINPNKDLMSGKYSEKLIADITREAIKQGVDPHTAIAVSLQESNLGRRDNNVGHVLDRYDTGDPVADMISVLKNSQDKAKSLGLKNENDILQTYNGRGKIFPSTEQSYHGFKMKQAYGVDVPAGGIDMRKNPLYGKRVVDLRENVIKQNPTINTIVGNKGLSTDPFKTPSNSFAEGGEIDPKKPLYVESKNDPRYKAYQDSLALYKRGSEKKLFWKNNPNATNEELNIEEYKIDKKNPLSKNRDAFGANVIESTSMAQIGKGSSTRGIPQYKKPQQPVVVQKPIQQLFTNNFQPVGLVQNSLNTNPVTIQQPVRIPKYYDIEDYTHGSTNYSGNQSNYRTNDLSTLSEQSPNNTRKITPQYANGGPIDPKKPIYKTGDKVTYGTPEYTEAYNKGEVVTKDGQRSPILLDEVVIQNNYKRPRGFWEQSRDKFLKDNKDAGLFEAIGSVATYPLSVGQHALTYAIEDKVQDPSEAWGYNTKEGWLDSPGAFGRNFVDTSLNTFLDPANALGAGILTKENVLSKLGKIPTSIASELRQGLRTAGPSLRSSADNINFNIAKSAEKWTPEIENITKKEISHITSPEYLETRMANTGETKEQVLKNVNKILKNIKKTSVNSVQRLPSDEGDYMRAFSTGVNPKEGSFLPSLDFNPSVNFSNKGDFYDTTLGIIDHEVKHAFSPVSTGDFSKYKNYPTLDVNVPTNKSYEEYLSKGHEQQVRFNKIKDYMEKTHGIKRGTKFNDDDITKLGSDINEGKFNSRKYKDVLELLDNVDPEKVNKKVLKDVLNKAWVGVPATVGMKVLDNNSNTSNNVQHADGGQIHNQLKPSLNNYLNNNMKQYAQGGKLTRFDEGGTHEQNPLGGIPQGQDGQGNMNTVEQGETKKGNFVYSDRITLNKDLIKQFNLPGYISNKSVSEASKAIDDKFKDRQDKYAQETKKTLLGRLSEAQEHLKAQEQAQQEQINQSMQANSQQVPDMMEGQIPEGMEEYTEQGQQQNPQEEMMMAQNQMYLGGSFGIAEAGNMTAGGKGIGANTPLSKVYAGQQQYMMGGRINRYDGGGLVPAGLVSTAAMPSADVADPNRLAAGVSGATGTTGAVSGIPGGLAGAAGLAGGVMGLANLSQGQGASTNKGASALSGAMQGASAGAALGPWGAAGGAVIGGVAGLMGSAAANRAQMRENDKAANAYNNQFTDKYAFGGTLKPGVKYSVGNSTIRPSVEMKNNTVAMMANGGELTKNMFGDDSNLYVNRYAVGGDLTTVYDESEDAQPVYDSNNNLTTKGTLKYSTPPMSTYQPMVYNPNSFKRPSGEFASSIGKTPIAGSSFNNVNKTAFPQNQLAENFAKNNLLPKGVVNPNPIFGDKYKTSATGNTAGDTSKESWFDRNSGKFGEAMRYAPVAMNAYQLSQLRKPQGVQYNTLQDKFIPQYADEAQLQNIAGQTQRNQINALSQSGASPAQMRAAILGAGVNMNRGLSESYMGAADRNRATNERGQAFDASINAQNVGIKNRAIDEYRADQGNYDTQRSKFLGAIGTDIGSIGKEEVNKDQIAAMLGYTWKGKYMVDPKTGERVTAEKMAKDKAALETSNEKPVYNSKTGEKITYSYGGFLKTNKRGY